MEDNSLPQREKSGKRPIGNSGGGCTKVSWTASRGLCFPVADRLALSDQLLLPAYPFLIRKQLEDEVLWLPLQNVRHLACQVIQKGLTNVEGMADIQPSSRTKKTVHSRLFGRVAENAAASEREPLCLIPFHGNDLVSAV